MAGQTHSIRPCQSVCVHESLCGLLGLWPALSHASCVRSSANSLCWNSATIVQCPLPNAGPLSRPWNDSSQWTATTEAPRSRRWEQSRPIVPRHDKTGIQTFHSRSIFSRPWRNLRYELLQPRRTFQRLFRGALNTVFWALAWPVWSRNVVSVFHWAPRLTGKIC